MSFKNDRKAQRARHRMELLKAWDIAVEALTLDPEAPIAGLRAAAGHLVEWAANAGSVDVDHADAIDRAVEARQMKLVRELILQL